MLGQQWENINEAQSSSKNKVLSNSPDHPAIMQAVIPPLEVITSRAGTKGRKGEPLRIDLKQEAS